MRIAFFTDAYLPQANGVATTVEELRGSLVERDHKVFIVAPSYPKFKDECPNVLRLRSIRLWKNPELRVSYLFPDRILQKVLRLDVDVVHGFSGGATRRRARANRGHKIWNNSDDDGIGRNCIVL